MNELVKIVIITGYVLQLSIVSTTMYFMYKGHKICFTLWWSTIGNIIMIFFLLIPIGGIVGAMSICKDTFDHLLNELDENKIHGEVMFDDIVADCEVPKYSSYAKFIYTYNNEKIEVFGKIRRTIKGQFHTYILVDISINKVGNDNIIPAIFDLKFVTHMQPCREKESKNITNIL